MAAPGIANVTQKLLLERRGVAETVIGMNAAMSPLGILIFSVFIPVLARRFGARTVTIAAAFAAALQVNQLAVAAALEIDVEHALDADGVLDRGGRRRGAGGGGAWYTLLQKLSALCCMSAVHPASL